MDLTKIKKGFPGLTANVGKCFYDAIVATMHRAKHPEFVSLNLTGDNKKVIPLRWKDSFNDQIDRTFKEDSSMIDAAASGVSCLLATEETDYTIVERGYAGSGFDYYLGYEDEPLFSKSARLEISGIKKENDKNTPEGRLKMKLKQTDQSDSSGLPAYISIIEFSKPRAIFQKK